MESKKNVKVSLFFTGSHIYLAAVLLISILALFEDVLLGLIGLGIFLLLLIFTIYEFFQSRKKITDYIQALTLDISSAQKDMFLNFPLPFVVIDENGHIKWYNPRFEELFEKPKLMEHPIHTVIPDLDMKKIDQAEMQIAFQNKFFKIYIEKIDQENEEESNRAIYVIYFIDNTEYVSLKKQGMKEKTLVSLIFVDSYEEVMQSVEEVRRPLLVALIDRKLNTLAQQVNGIVRKFERDKYMLLFSFEQLKVLQDKKFEILDQVREINIGNQLPVTLSMGIGVNGKSLAHSMEYARAAIDLALGRGGDQAVIKNIDKYSFYGGKTKEVEKSTRVKARVKAYAFRELIEEADEILVMGHKSPDVDSLGAAIGVYRAAKFFEKKSHIVLNEVTTSIKHLYDRMIETGEYKEGIFLDNAEAIGHTGERTLLVVVDVHRPNYTECPELLELSKKIVVFDHHRKSAEFIENAVLTYLEPYASSTCELVTEILQYLMDKVRLKPIEADALLAGITVDTKNFVFKTGARTFEAAAFLRRNGADSTRVRMLFQNDMKSYKARASAVKDAEIYKQAIAISVCPSDIINPGLTAAQAADELLNISGIQASFVMCAVEDKILISARSLGDMNVQLIMEKLGGGGHLTVAGAQLKEATVYSAREHLKEAIEEYLQEGEKI